MTSRRVIESYFAAMRQGASAEEELVSLFAKDAVYVEPFSGEPPASGIAEIRDRLRLGWEHPLADMELDVIEVEVAGSKSRSVWECRSPDLPGPVRGEDIYEITDGLITRLEVRIL